MTNILNIANIYIYLTQTIYSQMTKPCSTFSIYISTEEDCEIIRLVTLIAWQLKLFQPFHFHTPVEANNTHGCA